MSLCLIVKNEEDNLPGCLGSAADLVDEVIVVDTGSTDATKEIARRYGAKVFDFPWCDSFAAARNESLRHATGDWVFWMDADDRLDEDNRGKLRALFAGLGHDNAAYVMKCLCVPDANGTSTVVDHVRLFRNRPDVRWTYRVHEQILPAVRRAGGEVRWSDVVIRHTGYQDPALRSRKLERDLRILRMEDAERPGDPFTLFNFGQVAQELGRHAEAIPLLRRSLEKSHPKDSIVRKLYALLAGCHRQLGQAGEALAACWQGRVHYPDDAELLFVEAVLLREKGDLSGAEACLRRSLDAPAAGHFASVDAGLRGYKARQNLAVLCQQQGRPAEAEEQFRRVLEERPDFLPGWHGLAELLLAQKRWDELEEAATRIGAGAGGAAEAALLRARSHLARRREFGPARPAVLERRHRRRAQTAATACCAVARLSARGRRPRRGRAGPLGGAGAGAGARRGAEQPGGAAPRPGADAGHRRRGVLRQRRRGRAVLLGLPLRPPAARAPARPGRAGPRLPSRHRRRHRHRAGGGGLSLRRAAAAGVHRPGQVPGGRPLADGGGAYRLHLPADGRLVGRAGGDGPAVPGHLARLRPAPRGAAAARRPGAEVRGDSRHGGLRRQRRRRRPPRPGAGGRGAPGPRDLPPEGTADRGDRPDYLGTGRSGRLPGGAVNPPPKPADYYAGCNERLARLVPADALRILEVGCGEGRLGARLKALAPGREVYGIEREPAAAEAARRNLDRVFVLDVEREDPPLEPRSLDVLLYGDVLEHLVDPLAVLRRHRAFLGPGGVVLTSVPNVQHHSVVAALLGGDFQYESAGLLDATHVRFFTWSTLFKLLLDAGFAPEIVDETSLPAPQGLLQAAEPLLRHLGLHPARTQRYLDAYQYVVKGTLLPEPPPAPAEPLTIAACVNDETSLRTNLLASPCLRPGSPHELLMARGCRSIADGLNAAVARAKNPWIVCVHQDVYLPEGWDRHLVHQLRAAEARFGQLGVAGVIGAAHDGPLQPHAVSPMVGSVVDRDRLLRGPEPLLPAPAESLDELLAILVLPKVTPLRLDPALGFHFYGADLCLQAREKGLAAVAVDALCFHNQRGVELPPDFESSGRAFAAKWSDRLPVKTTCAVVDRRWLGGE